jgi:hypothetical protein
MSDAAGTPEPVYTQVAREDEAKKLLHVPGIDEIRPDGVTIRKKGENTYAIGKLSLCSRVCAAVQGACALGDYEYADAAKASSVRPRAMNTALCQDACLHTPTQRLHLLAARRSSANGCSRLSSAT